jgi:hypothetical protein
VGEEAGSWTWLCVTASKPKCHMTARPRPWCGVGPHKRGPFKTCIHCIRCSHVRMVLVQTVGGNFTACMAHSSPRPSSPAPLWQALAARLEGTHSRRAGLVSWTRRWIHDPTPQTKVIHTHGTRYLSAWKGVVEHGHGVLTLVLAGHHGPAKACRPES